MNKVLLALVMASAMALSSCTTFKASNLTYTPVAAAQQYTVLGTFHKEIWVHEFLGTSAGAKVFNLSADNTDQAIQDAIQKEIQAKGGTSAVSVTVVHQDSFINLLFNGATLGLYAPGTVIIDGTVVR